MSFPSALLLLTGSKIILVVWFLCETRVSKRPMDVIRIGPSKTATTSIQFSLNASREQLAKDLCITMGKHSPGYDQLVKIFNAAELEATNEKGSQAERFSQAMRPILADVKIKAEQGITIS